MTSTNSPFVWLGQRGASEVPWSVVVKFYYSVDCGFLKGISCLALSSCRHSQGFPDFGTGIRLIHAQGGEPLARSIAYGGGSSNCFRRSGNIIDGARERGREGEREEGTAGRKEGGLCGCLSPRAQSNYYA